MRFDRYMKEEITYWAPQAGDDGFGKRVLAAPVTFRGRWEDKIQTVLSAKGEEIVSKATIYFPSYIDPEDDGWVCQGRQVEDPATIVGAAIIRITNSIPDLRTLHQLNLAMV